MCNYHANRTGLRCTTLHAMPAHIRHTGATPAVWHNERLRKPVQRKMRGRLGGGIFTKHARRRAPIIMHLQTPPTPVTYLHDKNIWLKRDDLFEIAGVRGGKVRTCFSLARNAKVGLTTAGSRSSPQVNIVANIAKHLGLPCVAHVPMGKLNAELILAQEAGCQIIQHKAGYNSVIVARSRQYALDNGFTDIPFGMETQEAIRRTSYEVQNLPKAIQRIVMPVGSGMSMLGIMHGLLKFNRQVPVLGVMVGADPGKRIARYGPLFYSNYTMVNAGVPYDEYVDATIGGVKLDPVYEAKCVKFLQPGDLLWIVGIRQSCII